MSQEYIRVTPTSEEFAANEIPTVLASLHKLTTGDSDGILSTLNPLNNTHLPRFEFLALSEGHNEPIEFYYGADEHLDTLETRLRSIYPTTFDIERVEIDLATKLIPPLEFTREEFADAVNAEDLLYEYPEEKTQSKPTGDERREMDGPARPTEPPLGDGGVAVESDVETWITAGDEVVEVAPSDTLPDDGPQTTLQQPTLTERGTILARPAINVLRPRGVRWCGTATRKKDWMTTLVPFTEASTAQPSNGSTEPPLATLVDQLSDAEHPVAFQVVFQRCESWQADADVRKEDLADGRDTLFQELIGPLLEVDDQPSDTQERELPETVEQRIKRIKAKQPKRTFTVNLRMVAVPPAETDGDDLDSQLDSIRPVFDPLDGPFYGLDGQRLRDNGWRQATKGKTAQRALKRVLNRELITGRGKTRPDLVLNADELANFILVPSAEQLSVEGTRGTRAEQQSRNPLPRPHQDLMSEFRDGMAIGYALDENGDSEDVPTHIPPGLLPTHYGRFGTTGSGKSKALINDMLSLYDNTEGPVILIIPKNDDMAQNYMRAHARRFGMSDLEENVVHFPMPDVLPGFSFFDLAPSMESGRHREDAVHRKADHYEEILKLVMGKDRYERATVAPTLIKTLIKALFDEDYGRENGLYRESTDYFAHRQLEHAVDQLWEAGPPNENIGDAPRSSNEEVTRTIRRQLQLDSNTFANVMGGVGNRLAYISQDTHLRQIFNNTENQFDFRDVLDQNNVILFDVGDLRDEAARIMTGVILTNLDAALKDRKQDLAQYPDDYVVNLLVDEAASVVVSDIMNDLLEKGRGFRLSVGLSMQFPEQMQAEGGRKIYLNALNNIGSSLVGKINVDRELARAMAHEEMDPADFANRIRSLPRGEWIASLPSPTFGETGPYPFSLEPLPIPPGHPESEHPLTTREEVQFSETLSSIHKHVSDDYGVPETTEMPQTRTPTELDEVLSITDDELDSAIAKVVRSLQLRDGCHEENGWVTVEAVDDELRRLFEDVDADPPSYAGLADIRERSRYLETTVDIDADEIVIRLTEAGEDVATPDTGSVQAAGGSDHDEALRQIEEQLTALGFTVSILSQDGSEKPDARATHPDLDERLAIEVETTTPETPAKILTNLRKAQEAGEIPLFVVRPRETETYWAERVESILTPPVQELQNGDIRFYTTDSNITFNGGATEEGGVTAVRPTSDEDSLQNIWQRDGDDIVLRDSTGTEHIYLQSLDELSKDRVPAVYSYDHAAEEYIVYEHGEQYIYETKTAFESDWIRIKKPFVPEAELQTPDFEADSYAIVIIPVDGNAVVYDTGETHTADTLLETDATSENDGPTEGQANPVQQADAPQIEDIADDPEAAVGRFAEIYLVEDPQSRVTAGEVYEIYKQWAEANGVEPDSKPWFGRRLTNHVTFERKTERKNSDSVRYYKGLALDIEETENTDR